MEKYAVLSPKISGQILLGYANGKCVLFDLTQAELTTDQYDWLVANLPIKEEELNIMVSKSKVMRVELLPEDLSFDKFWDEYGYKVGNRLRARKLWDALSESDKIKVLISIPRYKAWLALRPHTEKLYPETFLAQRRFENEFKS